MLTTHNRNEKRIQLLPLDFELEMSTNTVRSYLDITLDQLLGFSGSPSSNRMVDFRSGSPFRSLEHESGVECAGDADFSNSSPFSASGGKTEFLEGGTYAVRDLFSSEDTQSI